MSAYVELENGGFAPEEFADIKRCLETLLSIREGSVPLDRNLGISYDNTIGYPMDVAKNMLALDIIEKVDMYEPRVEVVSVDIEIGEDGQQKPHIRFKKREE